MALTIVVKPKEACPVCEQLDCSCTPEPDVQMKDCWSCGGQSEVVVEVEGHLVCKECQEKTKYSIRDALKELATSKKSLMLVRLSDDESYVVKAHDPVTMTTVLLGSHGKTVCVKLTNKEHLLYRPVWR